MSNTVPAAFLSYSHFDDEHDGQYITQFRALLEREVRAQTGRDFMIFQDWRDIRWGDQWRQRIEETLDSVTFLIPILSPSFFASPECCREVKLFLEREQKLGRNDLILPVYYISSPLLSDAVAAQRDPVVQLFSSRQYADWRPLRLKSLKSQTVRRAVFGLAESICEAISGKKLSKSFTVPHTAVMELETLLQRAEIAEDTVRRVFDAYLKTLGDQATWEQPDYTSKPLWECLFDYLLDPSWMKSSGQHHLLQFISRLAPYAGRPFALRNWVRKTAIALGIASPRTFHADDVLDREPQPYLLLALSPEGNYYNLRAWFMYDPGECESIYDKKIGSNPDNLPEHLRSILVNPAVANACLSGNPPVLEFFLPVGLLNRDLDQWRPSGEKSPLSTKYGLVVRAGERLWGKYWIVNWGRYWNQYRDTLCNTADNLRTAWLTRARDRHYDAHLRNGRWIFCLHFTPDPDCFETLLDAGVAILFWPRQRVTPPVLSELKTQMAGQTIRELPEWLRRWRQVYWEEHQKTAPLSLLWDDPQRLPPDDRPLPLHPDF